MHDYKFLKGINSTAKSAEMFQVFTSFQMSSAFETTMEVDRINQVPDANNSKSDG